MNKNNKNKNKKMVTLFDSIKSTITSPAFIQKMKKILSDMDVTVGVSGFGANPAQATETRIDGLGTDWREALQDVTKRSFPYDNEPSVLHEFGATSFEDGKAGVVQILTGTTIIYGVTGSGKSKLIEHIFSTVPEAETDDWVWARFGEPESPVHYFHSEDLISDIQKFINDKDEFEGKKVFCIDSFRPFVYKYHKDSKSTAGKGGVNTSLYIDLTHLTNAAAMAGKSIIAVINPMAPDDATRKNILDSLQGSVTTVIEANGYGHFNYVSRSAANLRKQRKYKVEMESPLNLVNGSVKDQSIELNIDIEDEKPDALSTSFLRLFNGGTSSSSKSNQNNRK